MACNKNIPVVLSVIIAAALLIAGCGGSGRQGENAAPGTAPAQASAVPTATPVPTAAPTPTPTPEPSLWEKLAASGKLRVAICPDYAPFEFRNESGALVGADVSLAVALAEGLGLKLVFVEEQDLESVFTDVDEGLADLAISCLADTEERRAAYAVSDPYGGIIVEEAEEAPLEPTEASTGDDTEGTETQESRSFRMEGGMVVIGPSDDGTVMEKVNSLLSSINSDGLYDKYYDDALMLAEKMRLF